VFVWWTLGPTTRYKMYTVLAKKTPEWKALEKQAVEEEWSGKVLFAKKSKLKSMLWRRDLDLVKKEDRRTKTVSLDGRYFLG